MKTAWQTGSVLCLLLPWLAACTAQAVRPESPVAPRTVTLLDHGRHSSLLLTAPDLTRWRYAYGDWAWYVDLDQGVRSGARALLRRSPAALGRQHVDAERPGESLQAVLGVEVVEAHPFHVEGVRIDALIDTLERQFLASSSEPHFSADRQLHFVPHPQPYTWGHNSNHKVAGWLRELGVDVRGSPALGRWRVDAPASGP